MTQTNGHVDPAAWAEIQALARTSNDALTFEGWTKGEATVLLKAIGKFVASQTNPLKDEIAKLKARVNELEMTGIKFVGTYQRAASYSRGDVCNFDGGMWVATCETPPMEVPGKSVCWQLSVKSERNAPRQPTKGVYHPTTVERRT